MRLILIRGLPGSGKSTLAKELKFLLNAEHVEADQFFVKDDVYKFDILKINEAHQYCQYRTKVALDSGQICIVSNTFTTKWELEPYFDIAKNYGIIPEVILCNNNYGSVHGIPEDSFMRMKNRFQYDISSLFED